MQVDGCRLDHEAPGRRTSPPPWEHEKQNSRGQEQTAPHVQRHEDLAIDLTLNDSEDGGDGSSCDFERTENGERHVGAPRSQQQQAQQPRSTAPSAHGPNAGSGYDDVQLNFSQYGQPDCIQQTQFTPTQELAGHGRQGGRQQDEQAGALGSRGRDGAGASIIPMPLAMAATPNEHLRLRHQAFLAEQEFYRQQEFYRRGRPWNRAPEVPSVPTLPGHMRVQPPLGLGSVQLGGYPLPYYPAYVQSRGMGVTGGVASSASADKYGVMGRIGTIERPSYVSVAPSIHFAVSSGGEFAARLTGPVPGSVLSTFRLTPGARHKKSKRRWYFPLTAHNNLCVAVDQLRRQHYRETGVVLALSPIPNDVLRQLSIQTDGERLAESESQKQAHDKLGKLLPRRLLEALAPFQREGVSFVVDREGRGLIADEMGLGKTIQAIAVACVYKAEWPLLVMCPSSARYHWEAELLKWLDRDVLKKEEIQVVKAGRERLHETSKVVILSYSLALRLKEVLRAPVRSAGVAVGHRQQARFRVVVADECHYLKNAGAQRTKELLPLLAEATRAILLSGTPALSRPRELWTQLNVLNGRAWSDMSSFIRRYCTGGRGRKTSGPGKKWQGRGQGAANLRELHEMLKATVMVRRRKKDILTGLPPKRRTFHKLTVPEQAIRGKLEGTLEALSIVSATAKKRARKRSRRQAEGGGEESEDLYATLARQRREQRARESGTGAVPPGGEEGKGVAGAGANRQSVEASQGEGEMGEPGSGVAMEDWSAREIQQRKKVLLMEVFRLTGTAKIPLAVDRVKALLASELSGKFLVFAHHMNVMNGIEDGCLRDVPHIRIDGSTPPPERQARVDTFQTDTGVRVALLSLTAAGLALTLTAASRVLFAELFWTPGALLQAEDRCHRIGQTSEVEVEYLLARGTLDDALWPLIRRKMRVLGELVEGAEGLDLEAREEGGTGGAKGGGKVKEEEGGREEVSVGGAKKTGEKKGEMEEDDWEKKKEIRGAWEGLEGEEAEEKAEEEAEGKEESGKGSWRVDKKTGNAAMAKLLISTEGKMREAKEERLESAEDSGPLSDKSESILRELAQEDRDRWKGGSDTEEEDDEDADDADWESSGLDDSSVGSSEEGVCELVTIDDDGDEEQGKERPGPQGELGNDTRLQFSMTSCPAPEITSHHQEGYEKMRDVKSSRDNGIGGESAEVIVLDDT